MKKNKLNKPTTNNSMDTLSDKVRKFEKRWSVDGQKGKPEKTKYLLTAANNDDIKTNYVKKVEIDNAENNCMWSFCGNW